MFKRILLASLLGLAATGAEAEVAADEVWADQVWADWRRLAADAGTRLTARTHRQGPRLVLSDLSMAVGTVADPATLRLDQVVLQDNPDGTVAVILPDSFAVTLDLPPSPVPSDPDRLTFATSAPGLAILVTGIGDRAEFSIKAPSLTITLAPLDLPPGATEDVTLTLAAADLVLEHRQDLASPRTALTSTVALGALHADMGLFMADKAGGSFTIDLSALKADLSLLVPPSLTASAKMPDPDLFQALAEGLAFTFDLGHGPLSVSARVTEARAQPVSFHLTSASGAAHAGVDQTGFTYAVTSGATRLDATLHDPAIAVSDIGMGYAETAMGLSFGLRPTSDPQDFATFLRLTDLTFNDALWAAMDPGRSFGPHAPVSLSLALSGTASIRPEALRPGWQPRGEDDLPADILSLSLDNLLLSGFGARLTGSGALAFDNTDRVTFDGFPAPTGMLRFAATGVNALIDRMARASLISPDKLIPLRLGLAFIAKPGDGPDTLTSTVDFHDRSLILNGVKLR